MSLDATRPGTDPYIPYRVPAVFWKWTQEYVINMAVALRLPRRGAPVQWKNFFFKNEFSSLGTIDYLRFTSDFDFDRHVSRNMYF